MAAPPANPPPRTTTRALRALAREEAITLRVRGACMAPLLPDHAAVEVRARRWYLPGDVIVYAAWDETLTAHRVIGSYRKNGRWKILTQADAATRADAAVTTDRIIGAVVGGQCADAIQRIPMTSRARALTRFLRFALGTRRKGFGGLFLRHPRTFPADHGGRPWGAEAIDLHIAGGPYRLRGLSVEQRLDLIRRFGGFAGAAKTKDTGIEISVCRADAGRFKPLAAKRPWEYTLDSRHRAHAVEIAGLGFMARLSWNRQARASLWVSPAAGVEFLSACENFLRALVAYRLLQQGGVLLHSAGVCTETGGRLFFGHSGAGKSTLARMAQDAGLTLLSDDLNAVVASEDGFTVAALPFTGDLPPPADGRPRPPIGLFRIVQAHCNELRPMSPATAVAALSACAPYVNHDPHRSERLADNLTRIAGALPVFELHFNRDGTLWQTLDRDTPKNPAGPANAR